MWTAFRYDDDVRCVVLTGEGHSFCTGIDRGEAVSEENTDSMAAGDYPGYPTPWMYDDPGRDIGPKSRDLWKPVIAAVQGMACGGAFYMLGETEFIIAADDATFFDPHVTYGMTAAFEPIQMLSKMPFPEIMRMSLLGAHERMSRRAGPRDRPGQRGRAAGRAARAGRLGRAGHRRLAGAGDPGDDAGAVDRPRDAAHPGRRPWPTCSPASARTSAAFKAGQDRFASGPAGRVAEPLTHGVGGTMEEEPESFVERLRVLVAEEPDAPAYTARRAGRWRAGADHGRARPTVEPARWCAGGPGSRPR